MPDKKKKTREDALKILKQKAANNGLKNQAQQGARNAKLNTTTTKDNVSTTTSQTGKPSTEAKKSTTGTLTGSQSPSAARRSPSLSDISRRRDFVTTERAKRTQTTTPTRRTSSVQNAEDRRSGRYRNDRREKQSYINTPRNRVQYDRNKTTVGDRIADTLKGSAKQWAGGNMSSVGTAAQFAEPTVRGIQKTEYRDPRDTSYSLRSREEAERTNLNRQANIGVKEGRDLRTFKGRDYSDKNANLQAFIHSADSLIDSGTRDIERAKKGTGKIGSFAIDTLSNMAQMGGDLASNVALPGLGMVALGVRSAGMGSYQARQNGLDVNEQALHGMIDGIVEMGSEAIFGGVSALQKTYGKGMFSLADKLGWRTASSDMVRRMFKTDFGQALATHLGRLGAGMLEEGTEELVADVFEPALKYVFTKASDPTYQFEGIDLKQMGYDFLLGAMTAGVLGGGSTVSGIRTDSQAYVDGQNYVQDLVNNARVQGRMGEATSNAEILADRLQSQIDRGVTASPYQIRTLQEALGESRDMNARAFERRGVEETQRAYQEGRLRESTGTRAELSAYDRGVETVVQRNEERARQTMGADSSEISVGAVGRVLSGTADINDFETILTDKKAKDAVETLTGSKLAINNAEARGSLEDLTLMNEIANKDTIRKEAQAAHAEDIRAELTNMDKRGGDIFAKNYAEAVRTIGSGAVYEDVFTRLYADGTVKESSFEDAYNRIVLQNGGEVAQYFTEAKAREAFNAGRMAMITQNGQTTAKNMAEKASMNPAGISFEGNAKNLISSKQATALQKFAERSNVHIRVVETMSKTLDDGTVLSANGSYRDGTIYIAADASNKLVTVAKHEMTHHIKKMSPERYQELEDFVFRKWYENDATRMEDEIRKKQLLYGDISVEEAREEIIADASEAFFTDEGAIQEVCSFSKKLGRAIHDGIKTLLDTFLDLQDSDNLSKRGYGDFLDDIGILREAERMWLEALEDSREKSKGTAKSENIEALEGENLFSIKDDKARWTDDRIDDLIKLYGASDRSYSRAYAVLMNPRDFLKLTLSDESLDEWNRLSSEVDPIKGDQRWVFRKLDRNDLANIREDAPYLQIYSNDGTMVQGHEGRHRMRALMEAGVKSVPIAIRDTDTKYTKTNIDSMTLSSQDFGYDPVNNNAQITIHDLVPIKESNRAELIEKFGGEADVKFSLKASDQAYMDAVNRGDMETAQKMVDEAAKKAGYNVKAYHGTPSKGFTVFDRNKKVNGRVFGDGSYFTSEREAAKPYASDRKVFDREGNRLVSLGEPGIYDVYLKPGADALEFDWANFTYNGRKVGRAGRMPMIQMDIEANPEKDVIVRNINDGSDVTSTVYVIKNPNQIKSADPVTYDDQGNIIPLSERFKQENEDIRYSVKETETTDRNINKLDKSGNVLTTKSGDPIAKFEKDGSAQFSLKTYEDDGRRIYRDYLNKMVKSGELKRAEADQMYNELETIYKITREYADSGKYVPFTAWSNAEVVIGENGKPVFSAIKANSEYKMNIDFSTICKKRRTLDNVFRVMVNRGLFEQLDLNKDESAALVVNINDLIREHGFEAACALCFVEARRYRQQQTATTFRDMWNGLVESMYKDKSKIEHFNYGKNESVREVPDGIHTMSDKDLDLSYVRKLATAKNDEGKLLQTAEAKAARLLLKDPSQRKLMLIGDMMASTGFENMQVKNPELMKIYNAKKGTGGAKSSFGDVQYLNEILKPRSFGRKKAYSVSGVRIQSFSDYVPRMVFDYVQVIADLAAKRLPAHGYTKEVLFALQFGLTGVKINMSLVPDVVADGVAPGLDKNGNYVWNKDGTFPWEDYKDKNGRKMPGARTIQKAKGYKENCGTIAVGISDEQIWKMLHDPEIQMVIPYHKSSLNPLVAAMTNVDRFTDYTDYQNTRDANGKAVEKDFDWDNKLFRLSHGKDGKLLPKSQWGNVQELVQEYVDWCNDHNYTPKFEQFLYEKDGTINPGYYKMLEDFALLDEEGNFKPQDDVKMNFPTEDSAFGSMASFIEQGLDEDTKLEKKRADEIEDIVDEIEGMIEDGSITKQSIFSEALAKNMTDRDAKFQLKDSDSKDTIASQNTIAKLEDQVKDLKAEFKRTDLKTANQKDVRVQAGRLLKRHDSNMSLHGDLQDTFNKIFRLYKEKGTDAFDEVYEIAKDEAVSIVNGIGFIHDEGAEEYRAIKDYLRTTPITISEDMKKNITDFNDFRKRYFGKLKLTNGETSNIDNVYMELAEMFPEQFTDDYVNPADQLNHIVDVLDNYAPYYETLDGASEEMQDYVVDIASDIMETAYGLQTKKTFADKKYLEKEAAVKKAREKARESRRNALGRQRKRDKAKLAALESRRKTETDELRRQKEKYQAELWKANERTAAEKLRGEMDIQRLKKQQAESKEKARERKAESLERTKLLKIARRLDKLKTTEANRQQIDALIGDLDLVAKGMTDKSVDKLFELAQWYDDRAKNDPDFIPDSNIENKLKRLSKTHIKDMTIEEVRDLYDVLSNIENEIATEKKLIDSEVKKEIYEAGRETIKNINKSHGIANSIRKLDTFFVSGTLSPLRQIRRVTGYVDSDPLYIATKELADGQRKMLQYQMDSWKAFDRFMNDKKFIDSLNGKKAEEIEVTGMKDGEPFDVKITPDIRMAMYLAGMNEDNLRHMMYGGITLPDIKLYKKGKIAEAMESGETVRFSPSQIKEITSHMSKREKEFAQEAYKYYNITSPQAINEVSEVLKGYSLARVNNYFPIHTDSDFLTKEFESMKFDGTIEGMGFLKERVKASNPILMTGLVDTLTKSIEMNSKYVGLAIPVRNFSKILNVKDMSWDEEGNAEFRGAVKRSISKKWGKSVLNYIEKFMTDLQNGRKSSDEWGSVFSKARSRYAGAVLTLNASVAIKQAASYPTAAAVLGWAPLAKAMGNVGKVDLDLIAKYTPLQWYRSKGYSTTELGDITSSRTGNIPTPLNWIQGMDLLTTRKLWKASEYYVRQHNKSLKAGTDEYYKAVAEIYNKVIEETQPNYTTMQRPGLLRSDNEITLTLNMFKTQPYQNFNILFDAFGNYTAKRNQYKASRTSESKKALKEAGRDMQNAVTSQVAQLAVFAAMTSLWALFRRKDDKYRDEEGKLTIFSYMKKLGEDMISNLFAAVPLGADVYSMASSIFTGDTYYGFTSVTDSAITDVMDSFKNGAVAIGDWIEYGRSDNPEKKPSSDMYKETENVISSASRAMGIPASNLRNLVNGIYGWVAISADGEYIGTYEAQKMTFAKGKEMKQNLFRAYQNDKAAYEELRKMMIEDGFDEAKLDDYIKDQRKEHHTEEEQKEIDSTMQELEGSKIWKDATEDEKKDFTNRVTNMALGITNTDTESISKYVTGGLTEEQVILYKLALKKANRENDNNTSYNNDEKEAALRMLEQNYKLTQAQKDILKGKKS